MVLCATVDVGDLRPHLIGKASDFQRPLMRAADALDGDDRVAADYRAGNAV
jgi:hypothetical protein